jgi:hypothetical protein
VQEDWQEEREGQSLDEELAQPGEELREFSDEESVLSREGRGVSPLMGARRFLDGYP